MCFTGNVYSIGLRLTSVISIIDRALLMRGIGEAEQVATGVRRIENGL